MEGEIGSLFSSTIEYYKEYNEIHKNNRAWEEDCSESIDRKWDECETMFNSRKYIVCNRFTLWFSPKLSKGRNIADTIGKSSQYCSVKRIFGKGPYRYSKNCQNYRHNIDCITCFFSISKCEDGNYSTNDCCHTKHSTPPSSSSGYLGSEWDTSNKCPRSPWIEMGFCFSCKNTPKIWNISIESNYNSERG